MTILTSEIPQHTPDELKLFQALTMGHIFTIKRLITSKRVSVASFQDTRNGWSILFYAIRFFYNDLVDFLLDTVGHEEPHISRDINGNTALMIAVLFDNQPAFEKYLKLFPHVANLKNKFGESPLLLAAKKGNNAAIELLLECGAGIDEPDNDGNTPIHHAAAWAYESTIDLLIRHGCKYASQNKKGWTPVDFAFSNATAENLQQAAIEIYERRHARKSRLFEEQHLHALTAIEE